LDGEDDVFTYVNTLCEAVKQIFPAFDFAVTEYLPLAGKDNFISILAGSLIFAIETIPKDFVLIMAIFYKYF
jgi:LuxR family maltose regulon positive regulatory protein